MSIYRWSSICSGSCCVAEFYAVVEMRLLVLGSRPLLALTFMLSFSRLLSYGAAPFPQDLEAIRTVESEALIYLILVSTPRDSSASKPTGSGKSSFTLRVFEKKTVKFQLQFISYTYLYPSFQGNMSDNDTARLGLDFQRMLRINHMIYIAARDHVFAINLGTSLERIIPQQKLTWKTKGVEKCTVRGKNSDECYNYIKVLVPRNDETLFACGTNAFNPTCRNYKMSSLEQDGEEVVGQARCPFESRQSNVGLFAGGDFYSATMTDFLASDAVIYRSLGESSPVLRTVKYDSKWLREPHFLHAIEYGNYVYFFLSEIAVEYTTLGKVVFSRVARVCKNDNGGSPRVLERYWTSFLKARLNCSVPGDSFFYFDVLQSLTNVIQINHRPGVLGVFTTQANSITGSAVCAFYMDDIEKVFNGKFKEQRNSESAWTPVPDEMVPKPRPGSCAGDGPAEGYKSSTNFPDETLTFIKSYPLMDEAVPSVNNRPCFTRTTSRFKLAQIAVDTAAGPYKNYTVLFLGSENGRVLKVLANMHPNSTYSTQVLEDIDVYNPNKCNVRGEDRRILGLELDKDHHALFVAFSSCVIRVPLSRCSDYGTCKKPPRQLPHICESQLASGKRSTPVNHRACTTTHIHIHTLDSSLSRSSGRESVQQETLLFVMEMCFRLSLPACHMRCKGRGSCLSSRDPYCIWLSAGNCATVAPGLKEHKRIWDVTQVLSSDTLAPVMPEAEEHCSHSEQPVAVVTMYGFEQYVESGYPQHPDSCHDILATTRKQNPSVDSAYGKTSPTSASTTNKGTAQPKDKVDTGTHPDEGRWEPGSVEMEVIVHSACNKKQQQSINGKRIWSRGHTVLDRNSSMQSRLALQLRLQSPVSRMFAAGFSEVLRAGAAAGVPWHCA
ncbi:hypothetical protein DNTS_018925 [Danionella cerebrum]|uniref:Sema domain-containing protein n=1 Tax=Danionella cerebrum TaxID=2873325 RepID=A0A553QKB4_9TELE|nr:hypothetical protein DNTS_018925 [Danionella translucida]